MGKLKWIVAVPVAVVLAVVVGTWLYIEVLRDDPPERLRLEDVAADGDEVEGDDATGELGADVEVAGTWVVVEGSQAGYRVAEVLFGQSTEGVGRTGDVEGTMTIEGTVVTAATVTVDLTTVTSDDSRRDNQFRGRIMDTANHPEATFVLREPLELDPLPPAGTSRQVTAVGDLTVRGVTRPATFVLDARRDGTQVQVAGSTTIVFDDYDIPNPSNQVASTGDRGELELLLLFERAG